MEIILNELRGRFKSNKISVCHTGFHLAATHIISKALMSSASFSKIPFFQERLEQEFGIVPVALDAPKYICIFKGYAGSMTSN